MKPPDLTDLRQRFDAIAARFGEHWRSRPPHEPRAGPAVPLPDDHWQAVQELFTRDVTQAGLRQLVEFEAQDTFQYFTREIDFSGMRPRPWYERYPLATWKVFLAMAFRLSPARRLIFALSVPLLALSWVRHLLSLFGNPRWNVPGGFDGILVAATLLFALLLLELRDKLALKGDLEVARQIQFGLLPMEPYERGGAVVCASMRPANTVGGDYFDVIELGAEGRIAVVVADVAGKGMPAALLMAMLQGSLRTLLTAGFRGGDLIAKLNVHLHANIPSNRLITLFYGEFEPATGRLLYVNAGHNAPYLLRGDGAVERLPATAMALGIMGDEVYEGREARLEKGERLFLFTDGITEAFDASDSEYGEERLEAFLRLHRQAAHRELIDGVRADVLAFCGSVRPHDDMTLLVLGRDQPPT